MADLFNLHARQVVRVGDIAVMAAVAYWRKGIGCILMAVLTFRTEMIFTQVQTRHLMVKVTHIPAGVALATCGIGYLKVAGGPVAMVTPQCLVI